MEVTSGFKEKKAFSCVDGRLYIDGKPATSEQTHDFERRFPGKLSASQVTNSDRVEYDEDPEEPEAPVVDNRERFQLNLGRSQHVWMAAIGIAAVLAVPFCPTPTHIGAVAGIAAVAIIFMGLVSL